MGLSLLFPTLTGLSHEQETGNYGRLVNTQRSDTYLGARGWKDAHSNWYGYKPRMSSSLFFQGKMRSNTIIQTVRWDDLFDIPSKLQEYHRQRCCVVGNRFSIQHSIYKKHDRTGVDINRLNHSQGQDKWALWRWKILWKLIPLIHRKMMIVSCRTVAIKYEKVRENLQFTPPSGKNTMRRHMN